MKKWMLASAAIWLAAPAWGQTYYPPRTNPFDPPPAGAFYGQRFAPGVGGGASYYGGFGAARGTGDAAILQQLQQLQTQLQTGTDASGTANGVPVTGHPTAFFNYGHYFFNQGAGSTAFQPIGGTGSAVSLRAGFLTSGQTGPGFAPQRPQTGGQPPR